MSTLSRRKSTATIIPFKLPTRRRKKTFFAWKCSIVEFPLFKTEKEREAFKRIISVSTCKIPVAIRIARKIAKVK